MSSEKELIEHGGFNSKASTRRKNYFNKQFCEMVAEIIPIGSVVADVGSGAYGPYVKWLCENGYPLSYGIDASPNAAEVGEGLVIVGDVAVPGLFFNISKQHPEWIIFSEVGEHVPARFNDHVFHNLAEAEQGVVLSWAVPGQRGHRHCNCRMPEWVACEMGRVGFVLIENTTLHARSIMSGRWKRKLMVFVKP